MLRYPFIGLFLVLIFSSVSDASNFTGRVVDVSDGDSIKVRFVGKIQKVQLAGIDCPERRQPFGKEATEFTSDRALGKEVTVEVIRIGPNGLTLGEVSLPDGENLNRALIKAGLAWKKKNQSTDDGFEKLEEEARTAGVGLWSEKDPVPPWEYRKQRKASR